MNPTPTTVESTEDSWAHSLSQLEALPSLPITERAAVVEELIRNPRPGIRERALRVGVAVLSDDTLVEFLRSDADAVVRNAGLEILKQKGSRGFEIASRLLKDQDADVALQAVLILDHIKDPRGLEPLRAVLKNPNSNIVQAAIVAIGHLGDHRVIPDLLPFLESDLWLQMAAVQALGDLRSSDAIEPLSRLTTDLMIGPSATEAIAQIGGMDAYSVLSRHWLEYEETLDPEAALSLLAHVLEGLIEPPAGNDELRSSLADRLRDPYKGVRFSSARCLLALGPGPEDTEALRGLVATDLSPDILPSCLRRRPDLAPALLTMQAPFPQWGFLLCAHYPEAASVEAVAEGIESLAGQAGIDTTLGLISEHRESLLTAPELARPLLRLYLETDQGQRGQLVSALRANAQAVLDLARHPAPANLPDLNDLDRVVLETLLGTDPEKAAAGIAALEADLRLRALDQLLDEGEILELLPWDRWLGDEPERILRPAALAAARNGMRHLLPELRQAVAEHPIPEAIRALGELGDADSVPLLVSFSETPQPGIQPLLIEALGRIGGPEARKALRAFAASENELDARLAYRALAQCAAEEDDELFRAAASNADWCIRLAAVEALSRFSRPENLDVLSELAADPVALVAQSALGALRSK